MRFVPALLLVACLAATGLLAAGPRQGGDATAVLSAARQALGGEQKLATVKTFVATGRTRQIRGNNLVPIEFEIACELPDKFVRRDEVPAQETGITSAGFNGDALIQLPPPAEPPQGGRSGAPAAAAPAPMSAGRAGGPPTPPPDPRAARVTSLKQDFVRLTLGMFAASFDAYPLTFKLAGQAEAPQGTADIVDVKGPGTFAVRLLINSQTHLPIMVSWTVPATNIIVTAPGQPAPDGLPPGAVVVQGPPAPGAGASKEEQQKYAADVAEVRKKALATAKPIEHRIYYADYRDAGNGVMFPFRLRRAIGADTIEETNFDGFRLNARIDARKFGVVK